MKCPSRPRVSLCANYAVLFSPVLLAARASRRSPVSPSEFDLYQVFRRGRDWGGDSCFLQRSTSFSHELGDAFQIFYCVWLWAGLIIVVIDAPTGPVVAVEVFRGSVVAAHVTMTRAIVVVLARLGLLIVRRLSHIALSVRRRARRRRGGRRCSGAPP